MCSEGTNQQDEKYASTMIACRGLHSNTKWVGFGPFVAKSDDYCAADAFFIWDAGVDPGCWS